MPDGSSSTRSGRATSAAERIMQDSRSLQAALAWLAQVAPQTGLPPDPDGVALHFHLFARDGRYWSQLCRLFDVLGLSDR